MDFILTKSKENVFNATIPYVKHVKTPPLNAFPVLITALLMFISFKIKLV
jgi:hypothetical protein